MIMNLEILVTLMIMNLVILVMLMIMNLEGRQRDLSLLKDGDQIEPDEGEAGAGVHQEKRSGDHHWLEEPLCQKKSRSQPDR